MKKMKEVRSITSCGAVVWRINNENIEILLVKQSHKDVWSIPKGRINKGESLEQCAMREVKEETNVDISLGVRLPDCNVRYKKANKTIISYLAIPNGNQVPDHTHPKSEVHDARWISIDCLPNIHHSQKFLFSEVVKMLRPNKNFEKYHESIR